MKRTIPTISLILLLALTLISCEARDKSRTQNTRKTPIPAPVIPPQQYAPTNAPDTFKLAGIPDIGDTLPGWMIDSLAGNRIMVLSGPSITSPMFFANISGRICVVGYNADSTVSFLSVNDAEFTTDEGISRGSHAREVLRVSGASDITKVPGFTFYVPLKSGWNAAFTAEDFEKGTLRPDSSVSFFFKSQPNQQSAGESQ